MQLSSLVHNQKLRQFSSFYPSDHKDEEFMISEVHVPKNLYKNVEVRAGIELSYRENNFLEKGFELLRSEPSKARCDCKHSCSALIQSIFTIISHIQS